MSKHVEKYPGLYARCKAARVGYQVMYMRCRKGMTVDEALAIPVGKPGRKRKTLHSQRSYSSIPSPRIAKLRADYCRLFTKTGVLDEGMAAQLRAYADEQRTSAKHSARVSDEYASRRSGREEDRAGDDGGRDAHQVSAGAAKSIAHFLRS